MFGTLTIQELTDKLSGGHHEPERAALELRRRAHLKQDGALTALLRLARDGSSYALTALNDMDAPLDDLPQEATDQGLAPRNTVSKASLLAALHLLHYLPCFSCLRAEVMMDPGKQLPHTTAERSRVAFEALTLEKLTSWVFEGSHGSEDAARELERRARTEQEEPLSALIALAHIGRTHALIALRDMKKLPEDLQQRANDQGIFELVD